MSLTPLLFLTELGASQAQPEVIVNKALRILEALSPLNVLSATTAAPPGSPLDGDRYIVAPGATGAWANNVADVALYISTAWHFIHPRAGWIAYVEDTATRKQYAPGSPTEWIAYP